MKKLIAVVIVLVLSSTMMFAQSLTCDPFGVSPRDVERDTVLLYFDRAYNGLHNVGVETKMFFEGKFIDSTLTAPTWTLIQKPATSTATLGATLNMDPSTQVVSFIPDVAGTYVITFMDGTYADTTTINAGLYLGVEGALPNCVTCHNNSTWGFVVDKWEQTGHYSIFEGGIKGTLSSHYGSNCISCHTTGNDANASNQGFDDWGFVFPDSLFPAMWDSLFVLYPDAMERARIQCESCHGPASEHMGVIADAKIDVTLDSDNCAWCHDSGTHHVYPEQWDYSVHANPQHPYTRSSCAPCHNGAGFVEFVKGGKVGLSDDMPENVEITCATCHDPHDVTNDHQLRTVDATLGNGFVVTAGGNGKLCMNCHKSRRDAIDYTNTYLSHLSSHYGPHHGPQADMLLGQNVADFGLSLPTSAHWAAATDACLDCHMFPGHVDENDNVILFGSHTFSMVDPAGVENVQTCAECHSPVASFDEKKYYVNGNADLDNDGVEEGLQLEVHGLLEQLAMLLPPVGSPQVQVIDSSVTLTEARSAYNYFFVEEDRSFGIHNPAFTFALLKASIEAVGGTVAVDYPDGSGMPVEYDLAQNYPNPFNPSTEIRFSIGNQELVKLEVYDILGRLVTTLANQEYAPGTHRVIWDGTDDSGLKVTSGIYLYKLQSGSFTMTKKMILLK
jgi:hypothetical protein